MGAQERDGFEKTRQKLGSRRDRAGERRREGRRPDGPRKLRKERGELPPADPPDVGVRRVVTRRSYQSRAPPGARTRAASAATRRRSSGSRIELNVVDATTRRKVAVGPGQLRSVADAEIGRSGRPRAPRRPARRRARCRGGRDSASPQAEKLREPAERPEADLEAGVAALREDCRTARAGAPPPRAAPARL